MSDHQLVKTPVVKKAKVKKTPFFTKDLVKCVIVLASIALVASLLLGVMNWLTYVDPDETIMKEVAGYFGTDLSAVSKDESMAGENVNACFVAKDGDTVLGYCFYAVGTGAKDGTMELLVYINSDGVITEITCYSPLVLKNSEPSNSLTAAAIWTGSAETSNLSILATPDLPCKRLSQRMSGEFPRAETQPIPVITTSSIVYSCV